MLPCLFRIPSHGPGRSLRKPLVLQERPGGRPVSRIKLHNLQHEGFVGITDLSLVDTAERFQLLGRDDGHGADDGFLGFVVGDHLVRDWERPEKLMLIHDNFGIV